MSVELKPCPFCGEHAEQPFYRDGFGLWQVCCSVCTAEGPSFEDKAEAISAWDRRASDCAIEQAARREALPTIEQLCAINLGATQLELNGHHDLAAVIREYLKDIAAIRALLEKDEL